MCLFGLYLRALAWVRSLWKLDEPGDFQAVMVASRTLFEIAVDVTILQFDTAANPPAKMDAWEESAKLKSARRVRAFLDRPGCTESAADHAPYLTFLSNNKQRVEALRKRWWPSRKAGKQPDHPDRWTGRDLSKDADSATELYPAGKFAAYYARRYMHNCWNTHGSGLAGVRGIPPEDFPGLAAIAFDEATRFALIVTDMTLRHFHIWQTATTEFDKLREERISAKANDLGITIDDLRQIVAASHGEIVTSLGALLRVKG